MLIGSLFSGIGGLELGLEWAGVGEVVWQVEQDPWCREVLARHWPDAERFDDVCAVGASVLRPVDVICGGFPCQDVSGAGKGAGLAGSRSGLWFEFARIVGELRPRWVVVENVASGAKRWVDTVMAGLGELGYEGLPIPVSASDVGAPHRRARVFIVARRMGHADEPRPQGRQLRGVCGADEGASRIAGDAVANPRCEAGRPGARESIGGDGGEALRGGAPEPGRRGGDLFRISCDCGVTFVGSLDDACPGPDCSRCGGGYTNAIEPGDVTGDKWGTGVDVADGISERREEVAPSRLHDRGEQRDDAHGRDSGVRWEWPPRPDDAEGWARYIADGGPPPSICRGPDGLPCGMARREWKQRLKALGNAVVPQCAEVIGHVLLELEHDR